MRLRGIHGQAKQQVELGSRQDKRIQDERGQHEPHEKDGERQRQQLFCGRGAGPEEGGHTGQESARQADGKYDDDGGQKGPFLYCFFQL